ncbi:MAG: hypothetical protein AAFY71_08525 [Bacteroidota bacterium]
MRTRSNLENKPFSLSRLHLTLLAWGILMLLPWWNGCDREPEVVGPEEQCAPNECGTYPNCEPCGPPDGVLGRDAFTPNGSTIDMGDSGFLIEDGELTVETPAGCSFTFSEAENLQVSFDPMGNLEKIEGRASLPSPNECISFKDPVQFNLGYYTGQYVNEELDLGFSLQDDNGYFLFRLEVGLEMNVCTGGGNGSTKPIAIKAPVGGKLIYVMDCADPFVYLEAEQDLLGAFASGASVKGQIGYEALQPDSRIKSFEGKSVRKGSISFPYFDILEGEDVVIIKNAEFNADLLTGDPLGDLSAGFQAGINGKLNLSLSAGGFITFKVPIAEASAGIEAVAGLNGLQAKAFVNGLVDPDLSWWPNFLPIKPDGQMRAQGFMQQDGVFDIGLAGEIGIDVLNDTRKAEGSITATNDAFGMTGAVEAKGKIWQAEAIFRSNESELTASPPAILTNDQVAWINSSIDAQFDRIEEEQEALLQALENYQFELSLRGLRQNLPPLVDRITDLINDVKADIIRDANKGINDGLDAENAKLCEWESSTPTNRANATVQPYLNALNRLKAAVDESNDDATTRVELEAALRDLMNLRVLNFDYTFKIKATGNGLSCTSIFSPKFKISKRVTFSQTVINASQMDLLRRAADNVQFIQPASDLYLDQQLIVDALPTAAELNQLRQNIQNGITQIPAIGGAGYIKTRNTGEFQYFLLLDGNRVPVGAFDPFDEDAVGGSIVDWLL